MLKTAEAKPHVTAVRKRILEDDFLVGLSESADATEYEATGIRHRLQQGQEDHHRDGGLVGLSLAKALDSGPVGERWNGPPK